MKRTIAIIAVLFTLTANAQTIDTAFKGMTACKIVSFKAKYTDTTNVDHLGVRIISDDLKSTSTLYWALLDSNGLMHIEGNATIQGQDYANWDGSNTFPFAFIGKLYNLVFIKPE